MVNPAAEAKKNEGNAFFKAGDLRNAIKKYGEAIELDPANHAYWSNRSATYAGLEMWQESADDATQCIRVNKSFIKGYFRLASAQKSMGQLDAASETLKRGLAVEPRNADLKKQLKDIEDLQRTEKVTSFIQQGQQLLAAQDYAGAMRAAEAGLRLDAGNRGLTGIIDRAKPKFEAEERSRRAGLGRTELLKEAGDDLYKQAQFEKAIEKYTECLNKIADKKSDLAVKCYSNRSACYKQLSNFDGTVADCSMVLEAEPTNVKALMRRAQAFEAIERYRFALQDVRTVLAMPQDQVGTANWNLANGMQHRLNRVVAQLKADG